MGALAEADAEAVAAYAECQRRHAGAVEAYERVRRQVSSNP